MDLIEIRKRVMLEILDTEEKYVSSLATVEELWRKPMLELCATSKAVTESDVNAIFQNLPDILRINTQFLAALTERVDVLRRPPAGAPALLSAAGAGGRARGPLPAGAGCDIDEKHVQKMEIHDVELNPNNWSIGDACLAVWESDGALYDSKIIQRVDGTTRFLVEYLGFFESAEVDVSNIRKVRAKAFDWETPELNRRSTITVDIKISDIFIQHVASFSVYQTYTAHALKSATHLTNLMREKGGKMKKFQEFYTAAQQNPRCNGLDLHSFLIMPVQRIPRYRLLIAELIRQSDARYFDRGGLENALKSIEAMAMSVNEAVREAEQRLVLQQLEGAFGFTTEIVQVGRHLIKQGELTKVSTSKGKGASKRYAIFLFNNLFIYADKGLSKGKFNIHRQFPISSNVYFNVEKVGEGEGYPANSFRLTNPDKMLVMFADDEKVSDAWFDALRKAIDNAPSILKSKTLKPSSDQKQKSLAGGTSSLDALDGNDIEDPSSPGVAKARKRPSLNHNSISMSSLGTGEDPSKACCLCKKAFGWTLKRRSCRNCERSVCDNCSKTGYPAPSEGSADKLSKAAKKEKTCVSCIMGYELHGEDGERKKGGEEDEDDDDEEAHLNDSVSGTTLAYNPMRAFSKSSDAPLIPTRAYANSTTAPAPPVAPIPVPIPVPVPVAPAATPFSHSDSIKGSGMPQRLNKAFPVAPIPPVAPTPPKPFTPLSPKVVPTPPPVALLVQQQQEEQQQQLQQQQQQFEQQQAKMRAIQDEELKRAAEVALRRAEEETVRQQALQLQRQQQNQSNSSNNQSHKRASHINNINIFRERTPTYVSVVAGTATPSTTQQQHAQQPTHAANQTFGNAGGNNGGTNSSQSFANNINALRNGTGMASGDNNGNQQQSANGRNNNSMLAPPNAFNRQTSNESSNRNNNSSMNAGNNSNSWAARAASVKGNHPAIPPSNAPPSTFHQQNSNNNNNTSNNNNNSNSNNNNRGNTNNNASNTSNKSYNDMSPEERQAQRMQAYYEEKAKKEAAAKGGSNDNNPSSSNQRNNNSNNNSNSTSNSTSNSNRNNNERPETNEDIGGSSSVFTTEFALVLDSPLKQQLIRCKPTFIDKTNLKLVSTAYDLAKTGKTSMGCMAFMVHSHLVLCKAQMVKIKGGEGHQLHYNIHRLIEWDQVSVHAIDDSPTATNVLELRWKGEEEEDCPPSPPPTEKDKGGEKSKGVGGMLARGRSMMAESKNAATRMVNLFTDKKSEGDSKGTTAAVGIQQSSDPSRCSPGSSCCILAMPTPDKKKEWFKGVQDAIRAASS